MGVVQKITWTERSSLDLEEIFNFYQQKSITAVTNIVNEIIDQVESIGFTHQYQKDDLNPDYQKAVMRHFKVLYRVNGSEVFITRVFDTRKDSRKQTVED
ncbi:MAG TPA: hypothetical protein DDX92_01490 [Flavobacteriales bacterium]|nr:hypothetical protein [Flavobacteriales bacterium]